MKEIKDQMKKRALTEKGKHVVASFDLEAVIYLPKSKRTSPSMT